MQNNCGMQLTVGVMLGANAVPNDPETYVKNVQNRRSQILT